MEIGLERQLKSHIYIHTHIYTHTHIHSHTYAVTHSHTPSLTQTQSKIPGTPRTLLYTNSRVWKRM